MSTSNFDFNAVYNHLIEKGGKNRVTFINGINTDQSGFEAKNENYSAVAQALNISTIHYNGGYLPTDSTLPSGYRSSVELHAFHNKSHKDSWGNLADAIYDKLEDAAKLEYQEWIDWSLIDTFNIIPNWIENGINNTVQASLALVNSAISVTNYFFELLDFSQIEAAVNEVLDNPHDLVEAFEQYWSDFPISQDFNSQWTGSLATWLQNPKNSSTLLAHSQGNFFVEDYLTTTSPQNTQVIALGSPSSYLQSGGISQYHGLNITNPDDPVTYLQLQNGSPEEKILNLFETGKGLAVHGNPPPAHKLGTVNEENGVIQVSGYLGEENVREGFKNFVYGLHPQGFYFPNAAIIAPGQATVDGTQDDNWFEGSNTTDKILGDGRNDVLRGNDGNDTLIGGEGYDLLDGNADKDTADYSSSPNGINVWAENITGSDVYKVEDGFGTTDTLGNIEVISGSNHNDTMSGANYTDIFYGQEGNDTFWGQGGDDQFYGGVGDDKAYGGAGNDDLRGEDGSDEMRGEDGNDALGVERWTLAG